MTIAALVVLALSLIGFIGGARGSLVPLVNAFVSAILVGFSRADGAILAEIVWLTACFVNTATFHRAILAQARLGGDR